MTNLSRRELPLRFESQVQREIKDALTPFLFKWQAFLPQWAHEIIVSYDGGSENGMEVYFNYPNRWACLCVTGHWMGLCPEAREEGFVHEIVHMLIAPYTTSVHRITTDKDIAVPGIIKDELSSALEATTEDIAQTLLHAHHS